MQQSYKRTPLMLKRDFKLKLQCNFIEITQHHWCSLAAKFAEYIQNTFLKENHKCGDKKVLFGPK